MKPIITFNAGSSSLKFAAFDSGLNLLLAGQMAGYGVHALQAALAEIEGKGIVLQYCAGIGHRIVHGGTKFLAPTFVNDRVMEELQGLVSLVPLHMPIALKVLQDLRTLIPAVPHVVCFDTAFHTTQADFAKRLPLPREYHERGYQRYGFHGLNYEHVVQSLGSALPEKLLVAHLGHGASMCAIVNGRSVATTMGYSTADGLVMGTRTGAIDPGVLIALMRDDGLNAEGMEDLLYRQSGLLGVSGVSSDMRELLASSDIKAAEAVDYYCYHAARHAGSLAVTMGGIDGMVFTGGIGENSDIIRNKIMEHLKWLHIKDVRIVKADEEHTIARHVSKLLLQ